MLQMYWKYKKWKQNMEFYQDTEDLVYLLEANGIYYMSDAMYDWYIAEQFKAEIKKYLMNTILN